jgi:LPXTG-motif cell wall-anchored protein
MSKLIRRAKLPLIVRPPGRVSKFPNSKSKTPTATPAQTVAPAQVTAPAPAPYVMPDFAALFPPPPPLPPPLASITPSLPAYGSSLLPSVADGAAQTVPAGVDQTKTAFVIAGVILVGGLFFAFTRRR